MQFLESDRVSRVRDHELLRAARHYRRAIAALSESTFEYLNPITAARLRDHLEHEMMTVTAELTRRGISADEAMVAVRVPPESETYPVAPAAEAA